MMEVQADWASVRDRLSPSAIALYDLDDGQPYTYHEMADRAARAAHWVKHSVLKGGARVAILARNHVAHMDLFLATGRNRMTIWPMNWRLSVDELAWAWKLVRPDLLVYADEFAELAQALASDIPRWSLSTYQEQLHGLAPIAPEPAHLNDVAMLLFTGGSTGRPKAVRITHRQIFSNALNTVFSWDLSSADRSLVTTPFFHTGGYHVLTTPLYLAGGTSFMSRSFDVEQTLSAVQRHRLTVLFMVPNMFDSLRAHAQFRQVDWSSVRFAISGGAPCPSPVQQAFAQAGISFRLGYGLTEVGPNCFAWPRGSGEKHEAVGVPVMTLDMKIVDETGVGVPPNHTGELWIRGAAVADGYEGDGEETGRDFDADGYFHTGDLARCDGEGFYYIVGRQKDLYISGGENVYPLEIEQALQKIPGIRAAAVVGVPDDRWGEVGTAFYVSDGAVPSRTVKEFLSQALARYKVPKYYVELTALPTTPAGKVDKERLKQLAMT